MIPPPICDGHEKSPMSDDDGSDTDSSFTLQLPGDRPISEQRRKRKFIPIQHDRMHGSDSETNQEDCTLYTLTRNEMIWISKSFLSSIFLRVFVSPAPTLPQSSSPPYPTRHLFGRKCHTMKRQQLVMEGGF